MTPLVALLLAAPARGGELAVWRDPERALLMPVSALPDDLQKAVVSPHRQVRLIELLVERPEDWEVQAVVRAEIARSGDANFAKQALATTERNVMRFMPKVQHWRLRRTYQAALSMYCAKLAERGGLRTDGETLNLWYGNGQHQKDTQVEDLRSVEEAYLALTCYRNETLSTKAGRDFLQACVRRFKPDAGLSLYGVRLYVVGVAGAVNIPLKPPYGNGGPARKMPEYNAPFRPDIVKQEALFAWQKAPQDPGVLAVVGAGLANLKDPLAPKAVAAYERSNDPDPFRAKQLHDWYPAYFKAPKI